MEQTMVGTKDRLKGNVKADPARRERLAAALRDNLKRRKSRTRALEVGEPGTGEQAGQNDPQT